MFEEIIQISQLPGPPRARYGQMLNLLQRICVEQSATFQSDYATLFSRLLAVCNYLGIDHRPADRFRLHARRVLQQNYIPTPTEEKSDLADLCHFIAQVYGCTIPSELPNHIASLAPKPAGNKLHKCLRAVIERVTSDHSFECLIDGETGMFKVFYAQADTDEEAVPPTAYLYKGANVMLLDVERRAGTSNELTIYWAVLEPDYLIDVTTLTGTLKPYGHSPLNFLINAFQPNEPNRHILLGNMANQFMDDCIHEGQQAVFDVSARRNYRDNLLAYAGVPQTEMNAAFFAEARRHFNHIRQSVCERFVADDIGIHPDDVLLEPSFICPTLGLRGRLDVMTSDRKRVLELKSGKAETFGQKPRPREEHLMQMSLYGEMLRRNFGLGWNEMQTYLFYSAYPLFFNERRSAAAIRHVLHIRNGIVCLLHRLSLGEFPRILPLLTPERLNEAGMNNKFYQQYLLPQLERITRPLQMLSGDALLRDYFSAYVAFIESELFLSKTCDNRSDSIRGFAATWTADTRTKLLAGNLLNQLTLEKTDKDELGGITTLHFILPAHNEDFIPNFSEGELVQVYEAGEPDANVTNRQLFRGTVTHLSPDRLTISLFYPQRSEQLFSQATHYAVEHDATDSPSVQQRRNLFSLLTATPRRRDLLLARRVPEADKSRRLLGQYPETVRPMILQAKQASDYYLLAGPPGTGKTNLALRSLVEEFLLERAELQASPTAPALMLTAYTNRAVDEICRMLNDLSRELPFDYLRIGMPQTCDPMHHSHLLHERAEQLPRRTELLRMLQEVPIITGTVITLTNHPELFRCKHFTAAIIDEASQLLEPQVLGLLSAQIDGKDVIDKFIFIGDHKQLPAVVMLPENRTRTESPLLQAIGLTDVRNSLFERLYRWEKRNGRHQFTGMLTRQGRMHPGICRFVNRHFYGDMLEPVPLPHQTEQLPQFHAVTTFERWVATSRMGFADVTNEVVTENIRANEAEAKMVAEIVSALVALHRESDTSEFNPAQSIGIIVPFRSQIACIRSEMRSRNMDYAEAMTIDTVECYQGSQRDYILFSTTISRPYQLDLLSALQSIEGIAVDRKLNVAVTRARKQFFLIGNQSLLSRSKIYRELIAECALLPLPETCR